MADVLASGLADSARILDAASVLLIDDGDAEPRLLMGLRRADHVFLPNKWVFPGGRLEASDGTVVTASPLNGSCRAALERGYAGAKEASFAPSIAVAAVRELFEETGFALAETISPLNPSPPAATIEAFAQRGLIPSLAPLRYVARAITPPGRPRRYDTHFFMASRHHAIEGAGPSDGEFSSIAWLPMPEARTLDLPTITRRILADLESLLAARDASDKGPVPFYYQDGDVYRRDLIPRT